MHGVKRYMKLARLPEAISFSHHAKLVDRSLQSYVKRSPGSHEPMDFVALRRDKDPKSIDAVCDLLHKRDSMRRKIVGEKCHTHNYPPRDALRNSREFFKVSDFGGAALYTIPENALEAVSRSQSRIARLYLKLGISARAAHFEFSELDSVSVCHWCRRKISLVWKNI